MSGSDADVRPVQTGRTSELLVGLSSDPRRIQPDRTPDWSLLRGVPAELGRIYQHDPSCRHHLLSRRRVRQSRRLHAQLGLRQPQSVLVIVSTRILLVTNCTASELTEKQNCIH